MATNFSHDIGKNQLFSELIKQNKTNPPPSPPPPTKNNLIRIESNISNGSWSQFSSASTSPLGSELSSAETDNNEENQEWNEDFIHQLTRQITDSMLNDDEEEDEDCIKKHRRRGKNRERFVTNNSAVESYPPTYMAVPLQRVDSGSGMTAVFLGKPGLVNGSYGTGVFLPRNVVHPPESRKKISGSSTVLIPTRVMQLLQLHFANVNIRPHQDSISRDSTNMNSCTSQHQPKSSDESVVVEQNQESILPQEWTY
ncbi:uncharacterized protein LOC124934501 [Impatiens glandulifera]|uniref:uncharacterized protein LOC124934501 n=1 Tax=Impatiens glandulifera TaxID=253017 RepID=UPI001FB181BC|nr:uncharacterized protein LOC124934501 [Impatiens glandulifera]